MSEVISPTFFVGALPPVALSRQVTAWQGRLNHVVTAPHITLKAPGRYSAEQLDGFRQVCGRTSPFEVLMAGVLMEGVLMEREPTAD